MAKILYLVHRLPYPPNKGDKVRSYHLLKHLAKRHEVFLGTFVDDPEDWAYLDTVRGLCSELCAVPLNPRVAKIASLRGLLSGEALSLPFYRSARLKQWVQQLTQTHQLSASVVFSSTMAQYACDLPQPMLVDFVDVDSAKWSEYAPAHRWPMSWLYGREGRKLLAYERQVAERAQESYFVTEKEVTMFRSLAPGLHASVRAMCNGVDADFFSPDPTLASPFSPDELPLVFTGAMDYWPNVDAVVWFVEAVLPRLCERWPNLRFYVVGRSPTPAVLALASDKVSVTGTVADVRPFLQHAAAVVAPLRLARGIQNKILEAMAMGRPVVAASHCAAAIDAVAGHDLLQAHEADDYVREINILLEAPGHGNDIGEAARRQVLRSYSWDAHLAGIDAGLAKAVR
ncbi:TIGR03087 family PEP-CTERM/XrtA system glycosyltransferase [Roseateles toxinivorans]|uniref:Sugar transferase (PEP-CTERM/EpsH1 system associated) n=1 Tax=Roseateles toxinivorans TaxID=270368 RepID=A0A4R6QTA4_9BURK|nr:TIGR03087 family PEP-CTERM/XrtA system glycosyltransferase [Roseateles toxinivorans]TDP74607.1 sugar transferase (PEP-CTERM/EpsH1 system associated) [Roseateles toxinivorans]